MKKVTEQELQTLRELNQSIAHLEGQIVQFSLKEKLAIDQILAKASALNSLNVELEGKYGKGHVNIETGEYVNTQDSSRE